MDQIYETIWLGNVAEAIKHGKQFDSIICVMHMYEGSMSRIEREDYLAIDSYLLIVPTFRSVPQLDSDGCITSYRDSWVEQEPMDFAAAHMDYCVRNKKKVLVHCAASMERSPLAVMWYLNQYQDFTMDNALKYVKAKHPITLDRREWLKRCCPKFNKGTAYEQGTGQD